MSKRRSFGKKKKYFKELHSKHLYHGCAHTLKTTDKRLEQLYNQHCTNGFDNSETWHLATTMANFILPRLKNFKESHCDHPCGMTFEQWNKIIDKMIFAFEYHKDKWVCEWNGDELDKNLKKVEQGLKLFAKYYGDLWW